MEASTREIKADEVLFKQGEAAPTCFWLVSGAMRLTHKKEVIEVLPGEFLGTIPFFLEYPYLETAVAVKDSMVFEITRDGLLQILKTNTKLAAALYKYLAVSWVNGDEKQQERIKNVREVKKPTVTQSIPSGELPENHPIYNEEPPESHRDYIFSRTVQCPICKGSFDTQAVRNSRLLFTGEKPDFRKTFQDFEPLWYHIWICSNCGFTYPRNLFLELLPGMVNRLRKYTESRPKEKIPGFSVLRTIDQVFVSYHRTLEFLGGGEADPVYFADLWQRLMWLYEDKKEEELAERARQMTLQYYEESKLSSKKSRSVEQDQKLFIVMAELYYKGGDIAEAVRYLRTIAGTKEGNHSLVKRASERIMDIRQEAKAT